MGGTFPFTAEGSRPVKRRTDSFDPSEFSYSFIKMMNVSPSFSFYLDDPRCWADRSSYRHPDPS